jgi:hypothetical protein
LVLAPGEGFFIQLPTGPTTATLTFVGEVPQGNLSHPVPGNNAFSLQASEVPQALRLGDTATAGTLNFPAGDGDTAYPFNVTTQSYGAYNYIGGFGWFNPDDPNPAGPLLPVATGFFSLKAGPTLPWERSFSVSP